jgi:hypothetical protein
MVVDAIKSAALVNADATPIVPNPAYQQGGRVRVHRGVCTLVTAAAEAGSTMRFCRVRSNDMVKDIILSALSLGTGCTMDIGVYRTPADGGAVRDADFFASALAMAAAQDNINVYRESVSAGANGVLSQAALENCAKRLWEALGYTVDPQCDFDIVGTLAVAATVAGTVMLTVETVGGY